MRLPAGPLLIVSPHLDDALLSCSALLARGEPAEVLVPFAGFPDPPVRASADASAGFADSDEAMSARHGECRRAFADTPHSLIAMDLLPGAYLAGERADADGRWIARAIHDWLRRAHGGTIALPAGAGAAAGRMLLWRRRTEPEPDHLYARDAGLTAVAGRPVSIWLYEEFSPPSGVRADALVRALCTARGLTARAAAFTVDRTEKTRRARLLHSRRADLGATVADRMPATERYWSIAA